MHLCSLLKISFQETKIQILEGIFLKDLSVHLLSRDHIDIDSLMNDIVNFERLDIARSTRIRQNVVSKEQSIQNTTISNRQNSQ